MTDQNKELIETVLKKESADIAFEEIPDEGDSPLAQPVVQQKASAGKNPSEKEPNEKTTEQKVLQKEKEKQSDAPEQEINAKAEAGTTAANTAAPEEEFTVPLETARLMADTVLGVSNNILEVGGGFFVKISKHDDFYDFEEIIQVIDEQNIKNIKRLKLDEEDKALLRPLLIQVFRKKSQLLTPEQQLLTACLSILIKKAKIVYEIKMDNIQLELRILKVIRASKTNFSTEEEKEKNEEEEQEKKPEEVVDTSTVHREKAGPEINFGIPPEVLEIAE